MMLIYFRLVIRRYERNYQQSAEKFGLTENPLRLYINIQQAER